MQLTEYEQKALQELGQSIQSGQWSNDGLVELIKLSGEFLNLKTIPDYCTDIMEDYAFQQAVEFTDWYRNTAFEKTMYKDTRQLYEQFMLERDLSYSNNKPFVIPDVRHAKKQVKSQHLRLI